jgi:hypothetical protein
VLQTGKLPTPRANALLLLQDIGDELVSLLHYPERDQLVAVTSTGSAIILTKGGGSSTDTAAGAVAAAWNVLLRMKITNAAAGSGLQVCLACANWQSAVQLTSCWCSRCSLP